MTVIRSINPEEMEFEHGDGTKPHRLTLILTDTDGQRHQLILEASALRELAHIFRAVREKFPGALSDH